MISLASLKSLTTGLLFENLFSDILTFVRKTKIHDYYGGLSMKLKKLVLVLIATTMMMGMGLTAHAESQNDQLALYYATLWQMGGNAECSAKEAKDLAAYYATLAEQEKNGIVASAASQPAANAPANSGITFSVQNVNASNDFYIQATQYVNSLPEPIKRKLSNNSVVFKTYNSGADYGTTWSAGQTRSSMYSCGASRWVNIDIFLTPRGNLTYTVYHEVGHALSEIMWAENGVSGYNRQDFRNCANADYKGLLKIRKNSSGKTYSELFADSYAVYCLYNDSCRVSCPNLYNYWCAYAPR